MCYQIIETNFLPKHKRSIYVLYSIITYMSIWIEIFFYIHIDFIVVYQYIVPLYRIKVYLFVCS